MILTFSLELGKKNRLREDQNAQNEKKTQRHKHNCHSWKSH